MRLSTAVAAVVLLSGLSARAQEKDTRTHWVYEGGWFARSDGDNWIEMNAETYEKNKGQPWRFKETKRTAEYVELRDAGRRLSVRLTADGLDYLPDDATEWRVLFKGKWKKPAE